MNTRPLAPHGTHNRYSKGCRCDECRVAHRLYERERNRMRTRARYGIEPMPERLVDATQAREHLRFLQSKGIGGYSIAKRAYTTRNYVTEIRANRVKRINKELNERLLAIPAIPTLDGQYVDAEPARQMVKDLLEAGVTKTEIVRFISGPKARQLVIKDKMRLKRMEKLRTLHGQMVRR